MNAIKLVPHLCKLSDAPHLKVLTGLLDDTIEIYHSEEKKLSRSNQDGIWLVKGTIHGIEVALAWWDFRVKGGSCGKYNCEALRTFLALEEVKSLPLILAVNSLGFRFMEGRKVFGSVFGVVPAITEHKRKNLVVTICFNQCLGLGALLFGMGHYRIAVEKDTTINLAGPQVFRLFFGEKIEFNDVAASRLQYVKTNLIHELARDMPDAKIRAKTLILASQKHSDQLFEINQLPTPNIVENISPSSESIKNLRELMVSSCDSCIELFVGYSERLKIFIAEIDNCFYGVIANPPRNMNNMFTYRALTLYLEALRLFSFLRLPLLVLLDTPGVDPRMDGNNQHTIERFLEVTDAIIQYPFKKMGVIVGRGFGGATTLAIPVEYGTCGTYILKEDTEVNVMHESIITELLSGSERLLSQWEESQGMQGDCFEDLTSTKTFAGVIAKEDIYDLVKTNILASSESRNQKARPSHQHVE